MAFSFRAGTNWCHDFPKLARESGFHFNMHRRRVRVDWNRISSIDIDRVIGERDFSTIDENVNNVIDYCLESEYDVKILDPNFVKLFRLAQLAVEYLLYCKQYLDHSAVILKDELRGKIEENLNLRSEAEKNEKIIKEMKEKMKERNRVVDAKLSDSHGEVHKCPQCPKTFISAQFMNAHVNRRHANTTRIVSSPAHEQYRAETEKLHEEIKSLKERLNLTERVIRNESEKFLSSESVLSNDNKEFRTNEKNESLRRDQDEIIKEQHRKYQEEIGNLKATLFDEIRSLKIAERNSRLRSDSEDYSNIKELIREQDNEIRLLRQQIATKQSQPEVNKTEIIEKLEKNEIKKNPSPLENDRPEIIEKSEKSDREALEQIWQSRMESLESHYRNDIETLLKKLKETQESADRARVDYSTRIEDLERREASLESQFHEESRRKNEENFFTRKEFPGEKFSRLPVGENIFQLPVKDLTKISRRKSSENSTKKSFFVKEKEKIGYSEEENSENSASDVSEDKFDEPDLEMIIPENFHVADSRRNSIKRRERKKEEKKVFDQGKNRKNEKSKTVDEKKPLRNGETKNRFSERESHENSKRNSSLVTQHYETPKNREELLESREQAFSRPDRKKWQLPVQERQDKFLKPKTSDKKIEDKKISRKKIEKNVQILSSESISDESESWLNSETSENSSLSQDEESEKQNLKDRKRDRKDKKNQRRRENNVASPIKFPEAEEIFFSKLRDLGIDPEWRGIPDATFVHVIETLRHHRKINSKKYRKFEEIRRKLLHEVSQKLISTEKFERIEETNEPGKNQLAKLVTNVKSKVSKAWNILDKNDGSHTSRTSLRSQKPEVRRTISNHGETRSRTLRDQNVDEKLSSFEEIPTSRLTKENLYVNSPERGDMKQFSHSYESIKDFVRDNRKKIVSSTPHKEDNFFPGSPKNSRGVLKVTSGSTGSLTKKKVLFDLETSVKDDRKMNEKSMYPRDDNSSNDEKNSSDSEIDISSIHDEKDTNEVQTSVSSHFGKTVSLKTSQSDKIAQISQKIEQQLSLTRKKPAGAIEAMFMEKFEKKEIPIDVYPSFVSPSRFSSTKSLEIDDEKITQRISQRIPVREVRDSKSSRKLDDEVANLESDIDELLKLQ